MESTVQQLPSTSSSQPINRDIQPQISEEKKQEFQIQDDSVPISQNQSEQKIVKMNSNQLSRVERFIREQADLRKTLEGFQQALEFYSKNLSNCIQRLSKVKVEGEDEQIKSKQTNKITIIDTDFEIPQNMSEDYKKFKTSIRRLYDRIKDIETEVDDHLKELFSVENDSFQKGNEQTAHTLETVMEFLFDFINNLMRDELLQFNFIKNYENKNPRCIFDQEVYFHLQQFCQRYKIIMQIFVNQTKTMGQTQELVKKIDQQRENQNILTVSSSELDNFSFKINPLAVQLLYSLHTVVGIYQDKRGQGASGKVVKVPNDVESGKPLAIKITESNSNIAYQTNLNEILVHFYVNSKGARNVLELIETQLKQNKSGDDEDHKQLFTKMEYAQCSLQEALEYRIENSIRFSEKEILYISLSLLEGLQDLHEKCQVAHRDIKPSNILFSETRACWVYSDLGIAQPFGKNGLPQDYAEHTVAGTAYYMCPEQLQEGLFVDFDITMKNANQIFSLKRNDRYALAITLINLMDLSTFENRDFEKQKYEKEQDEQRLRTVHREAFPLSSEIALSLLSKENDPFPYEQYQNKIKDQIGVDSQEYKKKQQELIKDIENEKQKKIPLIQSYWVRHVHIKQQVYEPDKKEEAIKNLKVLYEELIEKKHEIIAQLNNIEILEYYTLLLEIVYVNNFKRFFEIELKLEQDKEIYTDIFNYLVAIKKAVYATIDQKQIKLSQYDHIQIRKFFIRQNAGLAQKITKQQSKKEIIKREAYFKIAYDESLNDLTNLRRENILRDDVLDDNQFTARQYGKLYMFAESQLSVKEAIEIFIEYRNATLRQKDPLMVLLHKNEGELLINMHIKVKDNEIKEIPKVLKDLLIDIIKKTQDISEKMRQKMLELPDIIQETQNSQISGNRGNTMKSQINHQLAQIILLWLADKQFLFSESQYLENDQFNAGYLQLLQNIIKTKLNLARRIEYLIDPGKSTQINHTSRQAASRHNDSSLQNVKQILKEYVGEIDVYSAVIATSPYLLKALKHKIYIQKQLNTRYEDVYQNAMVYWEYMSLQYWKKNHRAAKNVPKLADYLLRHSENDYSFVRIFYYLRKIADNLENSWNNGSYQLSEIHEFYFGLLKVFEKYSACLPQFDNKDQKNEDEDQNDQDFQKYIFQDIDFRGENTQSEFVDRDDDSRTLRNIHIVNKIFRLERAKSSQAQGYPKKITETNIRFLFDYMPRLQLVSQHRNRNDQGIYQQQFEQEINQGLIIIQQKQEKEEKIRNANESKNNLNKQLQENQKSKKNLQQQLDQLLEQKLEPEKNYQQQRILEEGSRQENKQLLQATISQLQQLADTDDYENMEKVIEIVQNQVAEMKQKHIQATQTEILDKDHLEVKILEIQKNLEKYTEENVKIQIEIEILEKYINELQNNTNQAGTKNFDQSQLSANQAQNFHEQENFI